MSIPNDERLTLPVEQQALLWCMRAWVAGLQQPIEAGSRIQDMMARLDAPDAAPYLEGMMFALRHGATRRLAIGCLCWRHVSGDERMLLETLGLAQDRRPFEALLLLRGILTPEGARAALHSAEKLGVSLAQAGRFLPAPEAEVRRFAFASSAGAGPHSSFRTLH